MENKREGWQNESKSFQIHASEGLASPPQSFRIDTSIYKSVVEIFIFIHTKIVRRVDLRRKFVNSYMSV